MISLLLIFLVYGFLGHRRFPLPACAYDEIRRQFPEQGWFNSDAGDIAVKVCSNILEIPIIVLTCYPQAPHQSFVPPKMSSVHPLYVAFNHSPPGHYDATTG